MAEEIRIGVDVGGTFTDLVMLRPDGKAMIKKVLSSPPDFSKAIVEATKAAMKENDVSAADVKEYTHAATVATNAIITRTGAVTALLTTKGFRDVLEIRRMRMHKLYDIRWEKPKALVPRRLRLEISARSDPWGEEVVPLDENSVRDAVHQLMQEGVESVAICYLNSYANGASERRSRDIIKEMAPEWFTSVSSEVLPELKEYERTSTTVINAYVQPVVSRYFRSMEASLRKLGLEVPVMVMQSNGGMMPAEVARDYPIHIIESGPAAGVTGAYHLAKRMGIKDVMTLDMGGTTAKAAIIEDGEISRSPEYEVGGAMSVGHRLMKGGGYLLRVPAIDLAEVGAGGGSIASAESGVLKVGPRSAGAAPGPACYNQGGVEPTITDANVIMGLTNPHYLAGGALKIHPALAERAIKDKVASILDLDSTQTAWGIRTVGNSSLIRALRAVSIERGRDPRRFTLFSFGGMGPVQALDVAAELGIKKVVVPPLPGVFSALGLLFAEVEHHLIQTHYANLASLDHERLAQVLQKLQKEAVTTLKREGYEEGHYSINIFADTRYIGQDYALTIPLGGESVGAALVTKLTNDFHKEHEKTYGYDSREEGVQIVALRCLARGLAQRPRVPERLQLAQTSSRRDAESRKCYFGPEHGWVRTDVMTRQDLLGGAVVGPSIIEDDNSLTVVLPGWRASLDEWSNIVLNRS
jgi:N-methylhydantoinase A